MHAARGRCSRTIFVQKQKVRIFSDGEKLPSILDRAGHAVAADHAGVKETSMIMPSTTSYETGDGQLLFEEGKRGAYRRGYTPEKIKIDTPQ